MNKEDIYHTRLLQMFSDIENLEDFVKISTVDGKIDTRTAQEILRITSEAKERAIQ